MGPATGQIDGNAASQGSAIDQDLIGGHALGLREPIISSIGSGIALSFPGLARAPAVTGVVED